MDFINLSMDKIFNVRVDIPLKYHDKEIIYLVATLFLFFIPFKRSYYST